MVDKRIIRNRLRRQKLKKILSSVRIEGRLEKYEENSCEMNIELE